MRKVRAILRLRFERGLRQRQISASTGVSKGALSDYALPPPEPSMIVVATARLTVAFPAVEGTAGRRTVVRPRVDERQSSVRSIEDK
jgi:hypothetical protein